VDRPPVRSLEEYFARWQILHNAPNVDPRANVALRGFLTVVYWLARPFARAGVSPNAVTVLGLVQGGATLALTKRLPAIAALVILASSFTDGIDGCVAALTDRATKFGALFDSLADRMTEWCFVGAVVISGAKPWLGVGAAASIGLFEYCRARLLAIGLHDVGPVTLGERPTRVIACTIGVLASALTDSALIGNVSLGIVTVTSLVALAQLLRWAGPKLR
jgi:CDP-diacylglycerol---glycerol-3-phosphate 3-phosphatidyltransferase